MNKFRSSQNRVKRLEEQIVDEKQQSASTLLAKVSKLKEQITGEKTRQKEVLVELQTELVTATGQNVVIGVVPKPARTSRRKRNGTHYDRDVIVDRVMELRKSGISFDAIASRLNDEGLKPLFAEKFSQATVYQIHRKKTNPAASPIASAAA